MTPLTDIVTLTSARCVAVGILGAGGSWALQFPPPDKIKFVAVVKGNCWLTFEDEENTSVVITVTDTGEGISAEFLPYIFDRFRQAESTTKRQHSGLGLGLGIVRHLVEAHGGTIRASSKGVGKGEPSL